MQKNCKRKYKSKYRKCMKKIDSMNLVPFIDVMLVLLVIVLTTASFVNTSRIQVNVPKISDSSNKNQEINNKPLNIAIDSNGNFFIIIPKLPLFLNDNVKIIESFILEQIHNLHK